MSPWLPEDARTVYTTKLLVPSLPTVGVVSIADDEVIGCSNTESAADAGRAQPIWAKINGPTNPMARATSDAFAANAGKPLPRFPAARNPLFDCMIPPTIRPFLTLPGSIGSHFSPPFAACSKVMPDDARDSGV